ncbi:DUF1211 domain-containing protein [Rhodanobacter sp. FDAARGOS 1247]|uniref:TMEM175 family protein n=1 Tax=Rhodanobacter sp. FDAARGOS 1247 TaxID=2778082 RepID=UPI0019519650|nr:TMEM175 family protein [Rhodanobacter sp. FDAARGOS 1247]QRP64247.1 DUF1211 domain-containing protein [Rhodanobacter sp. FDAARGOS 1247]
MSSNNHQLERLVFFSDAVFAIAITLLVIEIHVPRLGLASDRVFLAELTTLGPSIFGFVLSFLVIGALWAAHHRVFGMICGYSPGVMLPNLLMLLVIAFMPFATALMSSNPLSRVPEMFYSATLLLAALLQRWLFGRALRSGFLHDDISPVDVAGALGRAWGLPVAAAMSLGLAWFWEGQNNFVLLTIPLLTRLFARIARARAQKATRQAAANVAKPPAPTEPAGESAGTSVPGSAT